SIAVAMGALTHPAAVAARRHASRFPVATDGCVIWGNDKRTTPDIAALSNGVLLRCYDYNDFFVGARNSGHASDMVSGVIATDEIESGDLNARGDLTMWKRFNGADAVRNSLQACLLASAGVEGAVRPFVGRLGFINKLANSQDDAIPVLRERLRAERPLSRV